MTSTPSMEKATMVSLKMIYNSPEKCRLRKLIKYQREQYDKKIRGLQQTVRRRDKQVATLRSVLDTLRQKRLLEAEQGEVLFNLGSNELLERLRKKQMNKHVPRQYEPQLRVFALTLHYYSPRAYEYVRNHFDLCLPHTKTISSWYKTINGNTGISTEALESIKNRVKNVEYTLCGSIQFDEMAIREHLEYDGVQFSGYVDLGCNIGCDDSTLATQALVFMVTCVNSAWKIPIAYYFIKGISAKEKSNLLTECLKVLHETGLKIISITCDGTSTNLGMFRELGCDFNVSLLQTYFPHPVTRERVAAFLDPCHMLKLVRNTFGDMKTLVDANNCFIQWSHIIELHELQESEGMHLGNKLRNAHINYTKQKMKVRLAVQIFSQSVADALLFCKNDLQLESFQSCEGTIYFISIFNDLFDILNSRHMHQPGFKQALNSKNLAIVKEKFNECKKYISSLKNSSGELIINSRRKTGFIGFLICIESALILYEELCEQNKLLLYIPFYKLSQDHVELLFGCLRHHGGGNNNPTVRQFKAAMKKILVHSDIRNSNSGNCMSLEEIAILHVTSANTIRQSEEIINSTSRLARLSDDSKEYHDIDDEYISLFHDHTYMSDIRQITELSNNIIEYIAGYIIKQLKNSLCCEICITALVATTDKNNLINRKNRGRLIQPSNDVIQIARKCETEIRCAVHESTIFLKQKFHGHYLTNRILTHFVQTDIFNILAEHIHDHSIMENHVVHLIRTIVQKYVKIRLHYITLNSIDKERSKSQRHFFNKLTLFKGQ